MLPVKVEKYFLSFKNLKFTPEKNHFARRASFQTLLMRGKIINHHQLNLFFKTQF